MQKINRCGVKIIYVTPVIIPLEGQSNEFIEWTKDITYNEDIIVMPDGNMISGNVWLNNQLEYDNGSYTKFLMNYYEDNV